MAEPSSTRIRPRLGALVAVGILAIGASATSTVPASGAPSQDTGLPQITVSATDGDDIEAIDCLGHPDQEPGTPGSFTISRTGPTTDALEVDVAYTPAGTGLPDPVVIPAGEASATVEVPVELRQVTGQISSTATYEVAGTVASFQVFIGITIADLGCNLGYAANSTQVVPLGQVPDTVEPLADGLSAAELVVQGDLPPGSQLRPDGTWVGATTEIGTFEATVYPCDAEGWCPEEVHVVVQVTEGDRPPSPPTDQPPAARPVPGTPTLTG